MRCIRFAALWVALGGLLTGCAISNVKPDYTLKEESKKGLAVVSFTFHGAPLAGLTWHLRQVGQKLPPGQTAPDQFITAFGAKETADWPPPIGSNVAANRLAGRLAVFELPAGKYEFWRWNGNNAGYLFGSPKPFSIKFEVEAGKATYVGDLHLFWENPRFNVGVFDRSERDLALLKKKVPNLTQDQIVTKVMEPPEKLEPK